MPYLSALSEFRHSVREVARAQKCSDILNMCDALRDDVLPNLGVRLEDREGAAASIKLVDRETLLRERDAKKQAEAQKQALKEKKRQEAAAAAAALEAQRKINPKEMFLQETDKYSAFDERVSLKMAFFCRITSILRNILFQNTHDYYYLLVGNTNVGCKRRKNWQRSHQKTRKTPNCTREEI